MKIENGSNGGGSINVENEKYKKCDNIIVGASFNDVSIKETVENDNPYAELEIYLENVKVSHLLCFFLLFYSFFTICIFNEYVHANNLKSLLTL